MIPVLKIWDKSDVRYTSRRVRDSKAIRSPSGDHVTSCASSTLKLLSMPIGVGVGVGVGSGVGVSVGVEVIVLEGLMVGVQDGGIESSWEEVEVTSI